MRQRDWLPAPSDVVYFLEVAHTQNISRAAERLGISQPSLSLAIQRLEASIGTHLLVRGKSGVRLTRAGERAKGEAERLLASWQRMKSESNRDEREIRGRYTIGCHQSVALYSFPGFLTETLANHPEIEISLRHDLSRRITEEVISFKVDVGIVVNPVPHPDLVIKKLCQDAVSFWTHQNPTELQTPKSKRLILALDPDLTQSQFLLRRAIKMGWHFHRMIPTSSLEVIAMLVESGSAMGILPNRVAGKSGLLKVATKDAPEYLDEVCVVYRADFLHSRGGQTIVDAIKSGFKSRQEPKSRSRGAES